MERLRSPHSSAAQGSGAEAAPVALSQLLESVNSPGAERKDVDALLAGLSLPLAADETPRSRADFLLGLLNSRRLVSMRGSKGGTVREAAVQAMMGLGHPYALEIPPEALLRQGRRSRASSGTGRRRIPREGVILALIGSVPALFAPPVSLLWAAPAMWAIFGGKAGRHGQQTLGLVLMWLLGLCAIVIGGGFLIEGRSHSGGGFLDLTTAFGTIGVGFGSCLALGAYLLRPSAWLIEDTPSEEDEAA